MQCCAIPAGSMIGSHHACAIPEGDDSSSIITRRGWQTSNPSIVFQIKKSRYSSDIILLATLHSSINADRQSAGSLSRKRKF
jgi:hypothetical protein